MARFQNGHSRETLMVNMLTVAVDKKNHCSPIVIVSKDVPYPYCKR
jgi:hypothetical protein